MSNETSITWNFRQYFENKAFVAPIAEKSANNISRQNSIGKTTGQRLYYFAVGHKWKNLPNVIFQRFYDEQQEQYVTGDYMALQKEAFPKKDIEELLSLPLKSPNKREVIHPWLLAYYFEQVQKSSHGSFEVVSSCCQ